MAEHNITGKKGEILAMNYLRDNSYNIIATNWRLRHLEIDIIASENNQLIFVEVKTRHSTQWGDPETAVGVKKQRFLTQAANEYIYQTNYHGNVRFDIIGILFTPKGHNLIHVKDAFFPGLF